MKLLGEFFISLVFFVFSVVFVCLTVSIALGQTGKHLSKGDIAPFDGVLLDKDALVKIISESEESEAICDLEKEVLRDECLFEKDILTSDFEHELNQKDDRYEAIILDTNEELGKVRAELEDSDFETILWSVGAGAAGLLVGGTVVFLIERL